MLVAAPAAPAQVTIAINPGSGLAGNADALAAFNAAAAEWTSRLTTAPTVGPITIRINADLTNLGNVNVIGQASVAAFTDSYDAFRANLVATAAGQPSKAILNSLPTAAQFTAALPGGRTFDGTITASTANAKALGYTFSPTQVDGTITFNSQFAFDYDRTNGTTATDFQTVAGHEIGHVLGFVSAVDDIDETTAAQYPNVTVNPLDLFRFNNAGPKPVTAADFTSFARELRPGQEAVTSDTASEYRMSTGRLTGDGRQASHWKDTPAVAQRIGIMDPTLGSGEVWDITAADLRAFELIGFNLIPIPEPGALMVVAAVGLAAVARTAAARPGPPDQIA
jgi:hypothetical protein